MRTKKFRLMWADIHHKGNEITPWYYFDFDKLNELGYQDQDIFEFVKNHSAKAEVACLKSLHFRVVFEHAQKYTTFKNEIVDLSTGLKTSGIFLTY